MDDIGGYDTKSSSALDLLGSEPWVRHYEQGGDPGGRIVDRLDTAPPPYFSESKLGDAGSMPRGATRSDLGQVPSDDPIQRLFGGLF